MLEKYWPYAGYVPAPVRHEQTSHCILTRIWTQHGLSSGARIFYAGIVRAHHQGRFGEPGRTSAPEWVNLQNEFELTMRRTFLSEALHLPAPQKQSKGSGWGRPAVGPRHTGRLDRRSRGDFCRRRKLDSKRRGKTKFAAAPALLLRAAGSAACADRLGGKLHSTLWTAIPRAGMRELQIQAEGVFKSCDERIAAVLIVAPMGERQDGGGDICRAENGRAMGEGRLLCGAPNCRHGEPDGRAGAGAVGATQR